jgi:pimeloyl-ACP methyl ester carboxylesterase
MFLGVNGLNLHYERHGTGSPVLVFVHGLGCSAHVWYPQMSAFSPSFLALAPTLRGHPPSDPGDGYSLGALTSDVLGLLRALGVSRCVIVAASASSGIGIRLAAQEPGLVEALVLVSGFAALSPVQRQQIEHTIARVQEGGVEAVAARLARLNFSEATNVGNGGLVGLQEIALLRNAKEPYIAFWRALLDYDVTHLLREVACPALVVFGPEDRMVDASRQFELARALPRATPKVIAGCGHCPNLEKPELFNAAVMEFLATVARAR